jgi:hypothetical protein
MPASTAASNGSCRRLHTCSTGSICCSRHKVLLILASQPKTRPPPPLLLLLLLGKVLEV